MKFNGKGYYSYVHDRLNESLADKLEKPLDEDETKEIGEEIIEEIAKERVFTNDYKLTQRIHIANSLELGALVGTMMYVGSSGPVVAAIVGAGVTICNYYSIRRANKLANDKTMRKYEWLLLKISKGNVLSSPQTMAINHARSQMCYDLGLRSALSEGVNKIYDEAYKQIKKIHRGDKIILGLTSAGVGYISDQTAVGIGVGIIYAALHYTINATNLLKQPYYKRKIDEGIQRIVDEYNAPKPDNPTTPLHIA